MIFFLLWRSHSCYSLLCYSLRSSSGCSCPPCLYSTSSLRACAWVAAFAVARAPSSSLFICTSFSVYIRRASSSTALLALYSASSTSSLPLLSSSSSRSCWASLIVSLLISDGLASQPCWSNGTRILAYLSYRYCPASAAFRASGSPYLTCWFVVVIILVIWFYNLVENRRGLIQT